MFTSQSGIDLRNGCCIDINSLNWKKNQQMVKFEFINILEKTEIIDSLKFGSSS